MARIELRDCTIRIQDGLSGSGAVDDVAGGAMGATSLTIDTVVLNTEDTALVPVGARFTVDGETGTPVHTVTARTPASMSPTTDIDFTPALASAVVDDAVITFLPQQISVKIGEGNLTYTENKDYEYQTDRGDLDTVRENNEVPMDVNMDFVYEFVTTGTGEVITPRDALKGVGGAAEWVSSSDDLCEPYCVDIVVEHNPPCGAVESETTTFPEFRHDTLEFDLGAATVSAAGRCNATEPVVERG